MIALDTKVLVRFLVDDDKVQSAKAARLAWCVLWPCSSAAREISPTPSSSSTRKQQAATEWRRSIGRFSRRRASSRPDLHWRRYIYGDASRTRLEPGREIWREGYSVENKQGTESGRAFVFFVGREGDIKTGGLPRPP